MKLSRSSVRRTLAAGLAIACLLIWAAPAFAGLTDPPSGTSTTNPNSGDAWWREGWGNSFRPEFTFTSIPEDPPLKTEGFLYRIDRTGLVMPTPSADERMGLSWDPAGSVFTHEYDLAETYNRLSVGERDYIELPGQTTYHPLEGVWYMSLRFLNEETMSPVYHAVPFGVDITKPKNILGFTSSVKVPTETSRRTLTWVNKEYDELSGGRWYRLYLNDDKKPFQEFPVVSWLPGKATIEFMPPGVNRIGLQVMDRATNVSDISWTTHVYDPDVPSCLITSPKDWAWLNGTKTFSVIATDMACDPTVTLKIDGSVKATLTKPPYEMAVDTRKLSAGKHTFTATAKDLFGHTRTDTRYFLVDNSPIGISSISVSPNPFYPVLKDGYKDTTTMKAYLNEGAVDLYLEIFDQGGAQVREYHKTSVSAGSVSMGWDGKDAAGSASTGTFWYRFVAKDRAGNVTTTGLSSVIIRDYEVVRIGPGKVRVVPR